MQFTNLLTQRVENFHRKYGIEDILYPLDIWASLYFIHKIVAENKFDFGICIAPEALRYAALFELFRLPILAVFMDDSNPSRDFRILDNLEPIRQKDIIVIEDDVVTGKTLKIFLGEVKYYSPKSISLFLGNPMRFQKGLNCIPHNRFKHIYVVPDSIEDEDIIKIKDVLKVYLNSY